MKRKLASVLVAACLTVVMTACGSLGATGSATTENETTESKTTENEENETEASGEGTSIVLKYAELNPAEHPMAQGGTKFAELVNEKSNGRIKVELYFNATLGDEKSSMQGVQIGTIDMFRANTNNMGDYNCKIMNALALPYVFTDLEHLHTTLKGEIGQELLDAVQTSGTQMVALGYLEEGPRNMFFTEKAVTTLADLKGLKVRVPETELMIKTMEALDANPTPISYAELYTSLQTGVVDGAENAVTGYVTNSFNEVAPYYVKDAHTFGPGLIVISEKVWDTMSAEDQAILQEAAGEAQDYVYEITEELEEEYYKLLEEKGTEVLEVEDIENWRDAVKEVYSLYGQEIEDLVTRIQAH